MRFAVEPWDPAYGAPAELGADEPAGPIDPEIEVRSADWRPRRPEGDRAESVVFVDGVRRVDANVWVIEEEESVLGVCASYAAGAVLCSDRADVVAVEVRRGMFSSAASAQTIVTGRATYQVHATAGSSPEELWLGIQQRMGELERDLPIPEAGLTVVDGPLTGRSSLPGAVGYVKTHRVHYLPPPLRPVLGQLLPGERTPLFLTTTSWSRYSWYLRLPGAEEAPMSGIVRLEVSPDVSPGTASTLADLASVTLPRFASGRHKDPRAPQNLYPVGGLERYLRRRLGDRDLLFRALRTTATLGAR